MDDSARAKIDERMRTRRGNDEDFVDVRRGVANMRDVGEREARGGKGLAVEGSKRLRAHDGREGGVGTFRKPSLPAVMTTSPMRAMATMRVGWAGTVRTILPRLKMTMFLPLAQKVTSLRAATARILDLQRSPEE